MPIDKLCSIHSSRYQNSSLGEIKVIMSILIIFLLLIAEMT